MASMRSLQAACAATLLAIACTARADCGRDPECDAPTAWDDWGDAAFEISSVEAPGRFAWHVRIGQERPDLLVDADLDDGKARIKASYAIVEGRALLARGAQLDRGYELDAVDYPILNVLLVRRVLGRALPQGPGSVQGESDIDFSDRRGIRFATPSAEGYIQPPWHVTGTVSRAAADAVLFDLTLTSGTTSHMKGRLAALKGRVFEDGDSVAEWTSYGVVGAQQLKVDAEGRVRQVGPREAAAPPPFRTFADVRAWLAQKAARQLYDTVIETGMPHLEENLRYTTRRERRCVDTADLGDAFPVLHDVALQDCRLDRTSQGAASAVYALRCTGGHGTTGEARWTFDADSIAGTLDVRLGGKNMTFYQRITGRSAGTC
jgi:hypothetical protein